MIEIAIVDDHKVFLTALTELLNNIDDFNVIIKAENGQDLLTKMGPMLSPDVIILDLEMSPLDGLSTTIKVREQFGDELKILILSMHEEIKLIEEILTNGANGYVPKTVEADTLVQIIRQVHVSGFYLPTQYAKSLMFNKSTQSTYYPIDENPVLNEKEVEILKLICEEQTSKQIADKIGLTIHSVNVYRKSLFAKTGALNIAGLVVFAIKKGYFVLYK